MDVAALFLLSERTPDRAYYENLSKEEITKIEETLDRHKVKTFMGFSYWRFINSNADEGGIIMRRITWNSVKCARGIDEVVEFLDRYYQN